MSEQPAHPQDSEDATVTDAPAPLQPDEASAAPDVESAGEEPASGTSEATPAEADAAPAEPPTVAQAAAAAVPEVAEAPPALEPQSPPEPAQEWSPPADEAAGGAAAIARDKPEMAVGAAFAGGLVLALILKRFAR